MTQPLKFYVDADGQLEVKDPGVMYQDTAKSWTIVAAQHAENGDRIVTVHHKGEHYWAARGQQNYAGAEYIVYRVYADEGEAGRFRGEVLTSFPVARKAQGVKATRELAQLLVS